MLLTLEKEHKTLFCLHYSIKVTALELYNAETKSYIVYKTDQSLALCVYLQGLSG